MSNLRPEMTVAFFNEGAVGRLPGMVGVVLMSLEQGRAVGEMVIRPELLAQNGRLHAGTFVALADTMAGHATMAHLPDGATTFATVELKTNYLSTLTEGVVQCEVTAQHLGRTTHVWDAVMSDKATGKKLALYRCTQMLL